MTKGIVFDHVSFHYPDKADVVRDVTFTVRSGDFVGITGVNGSGKSTLTYCMNGLIPHSIPGSLHGGVTVDGVDTKEKSVSYLSHSVGMVFQNPDFSLFNLTVAEEVAFGLKNLKGTVNRQAIADALALVGLAGFENRDPQTLSFGEKQKVNLASVLALDVSYIVLDEPTAMLDHRSSVELYQLLKRLNEKGKTIIVVEHDTDFLWDFASSMLVISGGLIVSEGETREVLSNKKLLSSLGIKKPQGVRV